MSSATLQSVGGGMVLSGVRAVVPTRRSLAPVMLSLVLLLALGTSDLAARDGVAPGLFVAVAQLTPGGPAVYLGSGAAADRRPCGQYRRRDHRRDFGQAAAGEHRQAGRFRRDRVSLLRIDASRTLLTVPIGVARRPGGTITSSGGATRCSMQSAEQESSDPIKTADRPYRGSSALKSRRQLRHF